MQASIDPCPLALCDRGRRLCNPSAEVRASFDRFCLAAGIEALSTMMEADVTAACGPRHGRDAARRAHRWGRTRGRIGFHGGKIEVERPRVRGVDGREVTIPS